MCCYCCCWLLFAATCNYLLFLASAVCPLLISATDCCLFLKFVAACCCWPLFPASCCYGLLCFCLVCFCLLLLLLPYFKNGSKMTPRAPKMVPKGAQMPPQIDPKWPLGAPQGHQEAPNPICLFEGPFLVQFWTPKGIQNRPKNNFLVKKAVAMSLWLCVSNPPDFVLVFCCMLAHFLEGLTLENIDISSEKQRFSRNHCFSKNAKNDVFGALWDPDPGVHFVVVLTGFLPGYHL